MNPKHIDLKETIYSLSQFWGLVRQFLLNVIMQQHSPDMSAMLEVPRWP